MKQIGSASQIVVVAMPRCCPVSSADYSPKCEQCELPLEMLGRVVIVPTNAERVRVCKALERCLERRCRVDLQRFCDVPVQRRARGLVGVAPVRRGRAVATAARRRGSIAVGLARGEA